MMTHSHVQSHCRRAISAVTPPSGRCVEVSARSALIAGCELFARCRDLREQQPDRLPADRQPPFAVVEHRVRLIEGRNFVDVPRPLPAISRRSRS